MDLGANPDDEPKALAPNALFTGAGEPVELPKLDDPKAGLAAEADPNAVVPKAGLVSVVGLLAGDFESDPKLNEVLLPNEAGWPGVLAAKGELPKAGVFGSSGLEAPPVVVESLAPKADPPKGDFVGVAAASVAGFCANGLAEPKADPDPNAEAEPKADFFGSSCASFGVSFVVGVDLGDPNAPPGPKALEAPNADPVLDPPNAVDPKAEVDLAPPKAEVELAAGVGVDEPNADDPKAGVVDPNAGVGDPNARVVDPKAGVEDPNADLPNAEVEAGASVLGVLVPETLGDPKADELPNAGAAADLDTPNPELVDPNPPPKTGSLVGA